MPGAEVLTLWLSGRGTVCGPERYIQFAFVYRSGGVENLPVQGQELGRNQRPCNTSTSGFTIGETYR
jgi:hypothetical protein